MHARAKPSRFEQFEQVHTHLCRAAADAAGEDREHLAALASFMFGIAREDQERERLALVFRRTAGDLWELGPAGETRLAAATSRGVELAHRALAGERPVVTRAQAFAARITAAEWAERAGCPRLASTIGRLAVHAGHLEYRPGARPPQLLLR